LLQRILSVTIKEFIQLRRDRRTLAMVVLLPLIQLTLFGYALSSDIANIPLVVWDNNHSSESRALIQTFSNQDLFSLKYYAASYQDIYDLMDSNSVKSALVIPPDFSDNLRSGKMATVQFFIDGSESAVGTQALSNASLITQAHGISLVPQGKGAKGSFNPLSIQPQVLYNPMLKSSVFYLPGLVGIIVQFLTVMLTAFAIVRERETGTIEQLNVTPLSRGELIIAKIIPYIIIAYLQIILVIAGSVFVFGMEIKGSIFLLLGLAFVFILFSLGIGILISTVSRSQFQAMQLSIMVLLPNIILSGFIFPVDSMPKVIQAVSAILPLTYFLRILRGVVVKGVGMQFLWTDTLVLAGLALVTLVIAATRLRRTMA
jgi:ABC-2 type transport system permease protein